MSRQSKRQKILRPVELLRQRVTGSVGVRGTPEEAERMMRVSCLKKYEVRGPTEIGTCSKIQSGYSAHREPFDMISGNIWQRLDSAHAKTIDSKPGFLSSARKPPTFCYQLQTIICFAVCCAPVTPCASHFRPLLQIPLLRQAPKGRN